MTLSNTLKAAVLLPLSLALLAGCGAAPKKDERPREEIVRERAQERWNLLVKKDFGGAYDYLSAGARALQDRQSYVSMMVPRPIQWTRADVKTVDCPADESYCEVRVDISYRIKSPSIGVGMISTETVVVERWVESGGVWGNVPDTDR